MRWFFRSKKHDYETLVEDFVSLAIQGMREITITRNFAEYLFYGMNMKGDFTVHSKIKTSEQIHGCNYFGVKIKIIGMERENEKV